MFYNPIMKTRETILLDKVIDLNKEVCTLAIKLENKTQIIEEQNKLYKLENNYLQQKIKKQSEEIERTNSQLVIYQMDTDKNIQNCCIQ